MDLIKCIFFVDPQSGGNLALYDHGIFSELKSERIFYWCGQQYPYIESDNIRIKKIFSYKQKKSSLGKAVSYSISMSRILWSGIVRRPKAIHIQWLKLFWIDYIVYSLLSKLAGSKIIFTAHNIVPHEASKPDVEHYRRWYKLCDKVICHTETSQKELVDQMKVPIEKTAVIPHGCLDIPCDKKELLSIQNEYKEKLGIKPNQIVFGHLGFLSEYKGSDLLIKAWCENEKLHNSKDAILLIAGKKGQVEIPDNLPENVKLINQYLTNEEFKALLKLTDVMVMPYRKIDQSGLLLTLLNENIPFIVSDAGELSKTLEIANVGWCLDNIQTETIAKQILDVVVNRDSLRVKKNSKDWRKLHELFDWSAISTKTSKLYESLMK